MTGARPLTGRSVLELANWITGPMTAQLLAQLGADVTKVEAPGGDPFRQWPDGRPSPRFATYSRGKRSAVLDLTTSDGREAVHRLMAGADIVVMALRPDAAAALGVDYASLGPINPSAIFCDLTGFGPEPPDGTPGGFETVVQATSGLLSTLIDADAPA
ncbi:MAG TPA: CoA transferase, partial [Micromonosporaceae bacterium]